MDENYQLGATAWGLKLFGAGDVDSFKQVAPHVKRLPFHKPAEVIEIFGSVDEEGHDKNIAAAAEIKAEADSLDLRVLACGFNPEYFAQEPCQPTPHITSSLGYVRREAIARICRGIDYAAAVAAEGQGIFTGPSFMRHMYLRALEEGEMERFIAIVKAEIVPYAEDKKVRVAFEPLGQHEGYLLMPGKDARDFIEKVGSDWIGINGDTVHMAYGEGSLIQSLSEWVSSGHLFALHLSEINRKQWGTGDIGIRSHDIFDTLREAGYSGPVTLENFCEALYDALHIWRPDEETPLQVLENGAEYIKLHN